MNRALSIAFALVLIAAPAFAQIPGMSGSPVKSILDKASDSALDKLSKPGAFSADSAIKIGLPGVGGLGGGMGGMMKMAGQAGMGGGLDAGINDAAGQAASAAKPIFRAAIDKMSPQDLMSIGTGGSTAATQYLHKSAGGEIMAELTPLIRNALGKTGVLGQTSQLSSIGMSEDKLIGYVTQKTSDGIFTYMGRAETNLRQNPMSLMGH